MRGLQPTSLPEGSGTRQSATGRTTSTSSKIDSIGRLAGGVARTSTTSTAIIGYADLMLLELAEILRSTVARDQKSWERAGDLTRQLRLQPQTDASASVLALNSLITDSIKMLKPLLERTSN
jgi:hypothetical protein